MYKRFTLETTERRSHDAQGYPKSGRLPGKFLSLFSDCFARPAGRALMASYVNGLLSDVHRENVAPRTLQRLFDSTAGDEQTVRDWCQQVIAAEHAHAEAIGTIDETRTATSGDHTCGVKRQDNGNRLHLLREIAHAMIFRL